MQTQSTPTTPAPPELTEYALQLIRCKACQTVRKAGFTRDEVDDIKQDLALDLLERLPRFDPSKATYNTFISRVVNRKLCNIIRDRRAAMRDQRREECSLNDDTEVDGFEVTERAASINQDDHDARSGKHRRPAEARHGLRLDLEAVLASLPPDLRRAAELLQSKPVNQVAREMGIPHATFYDNHLTRLREAFTAKKLDAYLA